ncbi:MAG: hypothetical protein CMG46_01670 [Candidatus Marinimicrobia bacterium]|nr:hypothetical protein [Candidatus Neomarinimicrobiota bacterium]
MPNTVDFLNVDDRINGQEFVCISFLSPESVIKDKEGFVVAKFLQSYSKTNDLDFNDVYEQFSNFRYKYADDLDNDYTKENKGITSVRGVKIRGVYSTIDEAKNRAKLLQNTDQSHHVFVGQVGYWLPWDPCADKVKEEHFLNSELNDLMMKYKENEMYKDKFFEERKREELADSLKKTEDINIVDSTNTDGDHGEQTTDGDHGEQTTDGDHGEQTTDGDHGEQTTDGDHGEQTTDGDPGEKTTDSGGDNLYSSTFKQSDPWLDNKEK